MWTRKDLKSKAKASLKPTYWKAFLVSLVIAVAGGNGSPSFNWNMGNSSPGGSDLVTGSGGDIFTALLVFAIIAMVSFVIILALAFRIFIGYPLEVGGRKYFVQAEQGRVDMNLLGFCFSRGKYGDIIKSMLWRGFLNFLWFLLLIIPGIVMSYAYRMVPYILTDNPNIGYRRALQLSSDMTRGHKFDIFVLDLSFLGWILLGLLALFVGVLFVMPYINATNAELYLELRRQALGKGICTGEELRLES